MERELEYEEGRGGCTETEGRDEPETGSTLR